MKGLVLEYLHVIIKGVGRKIFRRDNRKQRPSNRTPRQHSFFSCGGFWDALVNYQGHIFKEILHHGPRIKVKIFSGEIPISEKMTTFKKLSSHSRVKKLFV